MANRPMAPHLQIWKWGPHMAVSILHRVTGDGMALTGLITGYLVIVLTVLMVIGFVIFLFFVMDAASSSSGPVYSPTPPPAPPHPPAPAIP